MATNAPPGKDGGTTLAEAAGKVLDHLPYADGSGRRRFATGAIAILGTGVILWLESGLPSSVVAFAPYASTTAFTAAAVLIVYAAGAIIEIFSEELLLRIAGPVLLFAASFLRDRSERGSGPYPGAGPQGDDALDAVLEYPAVRRLLRRLSAPACELVLRQPPYVIAGLSDVTGRAGEVSLKHIVDRFDDEQSRKWGRRLVARARDVGSISGALLLVATVAYASSMLREGDTPALSPEAMEIVDALKNERVGQLNEALAEGHALNRRTVGIVPMGEEVAHDLREFLEMRANYTWDDAIPVSDNVARVMVSSKPVVTTPFRRFRVQDFCLTLSQQGPPAWCDQRDFAERALQTVDAAALSHFTAAHLIAKLGEPGPYSISRPISRDTAVALLVLAEPEEPLATVLRNWLSRPREGAVYEEPVDALDVVIRELRELRTPLASSEINSRSLLPALEPLADQLGREAILGRFVSIVGVSIVPILLGTTFLVVLYLAFALSLNSAVISILEALALGKGGASPRSSQSRPSSAPGLE